MNKYILPLYNRLDIAFIKGKKSLLFDENKKDYIDFASGVGVNSLGYANKKVVKTIEKQAKKVLHTSNIYRIKPQEECAKKIVELSTYDMQCFFCNSGAEANETAIKLARKYGNVTFKTPKYKIITIKNSFHGRTIATLKATAQEDKHKYFAPYPDGFVYANDINEAICMIDDTTVGVMLELIQGEGGIFMQDIFQVQRLERILKEKKLLLIIDEVQTGVYRSGNFLISQYFGIKPDIVTLAKGLASGIPIGVMMTSLKDIFTFGDHGSTFGGNHLSTKVCKAVLKILEKIPYCALHSLEHDSKRPQQDETPLSHLSLFQSPKHKAPFDNRHVHATDSTPSNGHLKICNLRSQPVPGHQYPRDRYAP